MFLDNTTFSTVVASMPLFAIDLVVVNERDELLLGKRLNRPAKNFWFVPGGRVYKNESLEQAFKRLTLDELGIEVELDRAQLLGLFDHFYDDSVFGADISTHYVNAPHFLRLKLDELVNLPIGDQHEVYRWIALADVDGQADIHSYTKVYLAHL